eukprot:GGOE01062215.1.p1 GENE.GGOE01062215.1~~GGOE01062215.1.p1  ORF type:complete len:727 (+),score=155.16 GGOE01062215.1:79-2259(+)
MLAADPPTWTCMDDVVMNFIDYERSNNKLLRTLETDPSLRSIVDRLTQGELAVLVPQNIVLDDIDITLEFVSTHVVRFTTEPSFETLNGLKGAFSDSLDAILMEDYNGDADCHKIHVLRHSDYYLNNIAKLNIFVISDAIRLKWPTADTTTRKFLGRGSPGPPEGTGEAPDEDGRSVSSATSAPKLRPKAPAVFSFQDYVDKMRNKKAANIVKPIKNFIDSVNSSTDLKPEELPEKVRSFLQAIQGSIAAHPLWKGASPHELEIAAEGTEKYVMTKIYSKAFSPLVEDVQKDHQLHRRLSVFSCIDSSALDINPAVAQHEGWQDAIQEIRKINNPRYKTPRDKLICLINSCKIIFNILSMIAPDKAHGADDFLPCLILLVVKANPPHLHSNLKYISDYRSQHHMASEAGYYFTAIQSVMYWWENIDEKSFRMPPEEFHRLMRSVECLTTAVDHSPDFPTPEVERGTSHLPPSGTNNDDLFYSEPQPRNVMVDVEPQLGFLTKARLDQLMEQRFGGLRSPRGAEPHRAPSSPLHSTTECPTQAGSWNSNTTMLDYDSQPLRSAVHNEESVEAAFLDEEAHSPPPHVLPSPDTSLAAADSTRLGGGAVSPTPSSSSHPWLTPTRTCERPRSPVAPVSEDLPRDRPSPNTANPPSGSSGSEAEFVAQLSRYINTYCTTSHDPAAVHVDFNELRVGDLQQLVHRYNALLAFERSILTACRKANLLNTARR